MTEPKRSRPADDSAAPDEAYASMGARLREAREFLGLSQEVVADALGVPRASVSAMESGRRKVSSLELRDLARLYKRPIEFFYNDESERRNRRRPGDTSAVPCDPEPDAR